MKEYPILFQPDMVRAILDGRKTQTRRIMKPQPSDLEGQVFEECSEFAGIDFIQKVPVRLNPDGKEYYEVIKGWKCPYGVPGSILWVRESWRRYRMMDDCGYYGQDIIDFAADSPEPMVEHDGDGFMMYKKNGHEKMIPFRPSIHLKKEHARIYLQNTGVLVQRLQDISEDDAIAEGIESFRPVPGDGPSETLYFHYLKNKWGPSPIHSFQTLIQKIHGPEIWDKNPWVSRISFRVLSTTGRPEKFPRLCEAL